MKIKWTIPFLIFVAVLILLSSWNYKNRVFDWDLPGYIGCLYDAQYPENPDRVRILTYEDIRKEAPEHQYRDILGTLKPGDKARQAFAYHTRAFHEQLPYFRIKAGYNLAVRFMYELGFTSVQAVMLLSIISYFLSGLLLFYLMKIIFPAKEWAAIVLAILVMLLPTMTYMSRVSTPDMFIFQFMLVFLIGIFRKWTPWIMCAVLLIIVFTRPDYIPFALSYLALETGLRYHKTRKLNLIFFLQGIILAGLYLAIIRICHYPGWKDLFYDTFIYRRPLISAQAPDFGVRQYLDILWLKIIYFKKVTLISATLLGLTFYCSKDLRVRLLALLIFGNIYMKFVFFPHSSGLRFFFGFIVMLLLVCLYAVAARYNSFRLRKIA